MQSGEIIVGLVIALGLSLAYNVYQALKRRSLFKESGEQDNVRAQLDQFRHELRSVRSDLANERQKSETLGQQLAEAGRTRSTFLDQMGYFVRTPLNLIIGYGEMLANGIYGEVNPKQVERLTVIQRSGNDLLKHFTDMLELHRLETGSVELDLKPVPVKSLFARLLADAAKAASKYEVEVREEIDADIGAIYGDAARIEQVLSHLLSNAIRFSPKNKVIIAARNVKVKSGKADNFSFPTLGWLRDGDWIVVSVTDNGIGIPLEDQASIFETFYQVHREQTDDQRGAGLGLAIAKRLIELHRGVIWVKSVEGKGSTFFVALQAWQDIRATDTQERQLMAQSKANS
jgi:signal transduction histidine kinase